jgi:pyrimidine-nucleoside phosphorylase
MRILDIIQKKRDREVLTAEEIRYFVDGYTNGHIPDYQMSALLMAIFLNGMDRQELKELTKAMTESGDKVDLSMFGELSVDKHSTGGVGDKTTLIVAPLVAALGGKVAKMSGRGLGHTGGTVDKLESIPGFQTTLTRDAFIDQVSRIGIAVIGQSGRIAPADKKIYALRDVTATIDSIPLIASSIMSKKLAAGSKNIVLDVKFGSGAFMKSFDSARQLAETMVEIGQSAGRRVMAMMTNMDDPLGKAVGNALEVLEAVDVLSGGGSDDLAAVSSELAARMLCLCHGWAYEYSLKNVRDALKSGIALRKFAEWIETQGGAGKIIEDRDLLGTAPVQEKFTARTAGYIAHMDAELIGKAVCALGAGREKVGDEIDHTAGIILGKKTGDYCDPGEPVAVLHTSDKKLISNACRYLDRAVTFSPDKPETKQLLCGVIE